MHGATYTVLSIFQVSSLGLHQSPISIAALLEPSHGSNIQTLDVEVIWRVRKESPVKLGVPLADTRCRDGDFVANSSTGFHSVEPDKSIIVLSKIENAEGMFPRPLQLSTAI